MRSHLEYSYPGKDTTREQRVDWSDLTMSKSRRLYLSLFISIIRRLTNPNIMFDILLLSYRKRRTIEIKWFAASLANTCTHLNSSPINNIDFISQSCINPGSLCQRVQGFNFIRKIQFYANQIREMPQLRQYMKWFREIRIFLYFTIFFYFIVSIFSLFLCLKIFETL